MPAHDLMKKLLRRLILFSQAKKVWRLPPRQDLLILDREGSKTIELCLLGHSDYDIIDVRGESINIPVLLISLVTKHCYFYWFIRLAQAEYLITLIDTNIHYLIELPSKVKSFIVQNGNRDATFLEWSSRPKVTYYFAQSEHLLPLVEKVYEANFIVSGSINNNNYAVAEHKKITKVQWISQFRSHRHGIQVGMKKITYTDFFEKADRFALQCVTKFCKINDLTFEVLSVTSSEQEKDYYEKMIEMPFKFLENDRSLDSKNSYFSLSSNAIIVGIDSTLLYEAVGRRFRVAFLSLRSQYINDSSYRFGWPKKTYDVGPFWCNIPDEVAIFQILEYLFRVSEKEWQQQREKYSEISFHDFGNQKIKQILQEEGVQIANHFD